MQKKQRDIIFCYSYFDVMTNLMTQRDTYHPLNDSEPAPEQLRPFFLEQNSSKSNSMSSCKQVNNNM